MLCENLSEAEKEDLFLAPKSPPGGRGEEEKKKRLPRSGADFGFWKSEEQRGKPVRGCSLIFLSVERKRSSLFPKSNNVDRSEL